MPQLRSIHWVSAAVCAAAVLLPNLAQAYIGPGAGFALGGSILFGVAGILVALGAVLLWPLRTLIRALRSRHRMSRSRARRVIVLGLDGLDPGLVKEGFREGRLPHMKALKERGGFRPLATVWPAMSPVAWSGFATGTDAGKHNIFDFLQRDLRSYLPILSSTKITPGGRVLKIGPWRLPLGKPKIELLRRSKAFWQVLGENGVRSTVLRVPITFPPEKVDGHMLSAMCVPDLRGTQGTFSYFTASTEADNFDGAAAGVAPVTEEETIGGVRNILKKDGATYHSKLVGPENPNGGLMTLPVSVTIDASAQRAVFQVDGNEFVLGPDINSEWIPLAFKGGPGVTAKGIAKFRITSFDDPFSFYVTPIHIDPESPAMSISHPAHYAIALAKLQGKFATLGLAEDTWALNERVIDEQAFLDQAYQIHDERKQQFFHVLDRQRNGSISVVFDATDRIQHMFFRYEDSDHPANEGKDVEIHRHALRDLYDRADELVGETVARLNKDDVLFVISDHGFKTFQRGVNLNTWLRENGYLFLTDDPTSGPLPDLAVDFKAEPASIDWSRTRAYVSGLGGFYLNLKGREGRGIVTTDEAPALIDELIAKLRNLRDDDRNVACVNAVWKANEVYQGPYTRNASDVVVGFKIGYRTGWDAAVGRINGRTFENNTRSWSGDHCVDPRLVPGILLSSEPFTVTQPALTDMAPTILDLFGIDRPEWMTGNSFLPRENKS
jgi:predicted AlkP superfamily phosphohydrolase/phosphomutase